MILKYQLFKEQMYEEAVASLPDDVKCVIIYDRGAIDNKAYIGNELFEKLLKEQNLSELTIKEYYDMVIHLVTAADGKEKYYTLANNTARSETPEQAKNIDSKTVKAWVGHNNLKIIDNSTEFEEKLTRTLNCVHNLLGNPVPIKKQKKYKIDLNKSNLEFLNSENCIILNIEQFYLEDENKSVEKRLRKKTVNDQSVYYYTEQKKYKDGLSEIVTDKKVSEKDFQIILSAYEKRKVLKKIRFAFIKNKQYFKLDIFENSDFAILEIEPTEDNQKIKIPDDLHVIKDVTNDLNYQNYMIANKTLEMKKTYEKA